MEIYETIGKKDTSHWNYVIAGPWNHGGWSRKMEIPGKIRNVSFARKFRDRHAGWPGCGYGEKRLTFPDSLIVNEAVGKYLSFRRKECNAGTDC